MKKVVRANEVKAALRITPRIEEKERQVGVVEVSGEPQVVAPSSQELAGSADWWQKMEEVREEVKAELAGRSLPPPEEIIREMREERSEQILASLR